MQPVHGLGPVAAQFVPPVSEHAHDHQVIIGLDPDEARAAQRGHRDRVRIDRVGLAAVAGGEDPDLR